MRAVAVQEGRVAAQPLEQRRAAASPPKLLRAILRISASIAASAARPRACTSAGSRSSVVGPAQRRAVAGGAVRVARRRPTALRARGAYSFARKSRMRGAAPAARRRARARGSARGRRRRRRAAPGSRRATSSGGDASSAVELADHEVDHDARSHPALGETRAQRVDLRVHVASAARRSAPAPARAAPAYRPAASAPCRRADLPAVPIWLTRQRSKRHTRSACAVFEAARARGRRRGARRRASRARRVDAAQLRRARRRAAPRARPRPRASRRAGGRSAAPGGRSSATRAGPLVEGVRHVRVGDRQHARVGAPAPGAWRQARAEREDERAASARAMGPHVYAAAVSAAASASSPSASISSGRFSRL